MNIYCRPSVDKFRNFSFKILPLKKAGLALGLLGWAFFSSGCQFNYIIRSGIGQRRVLANTVPMTQALDNPSLLPDERDKLLWVQQVRTYAQEVIGLKTGKSYLGFYDTRGNPPAWHLSASRKDALQPYSWSFPIVGKFDYLVYYNKGMAENDARRLEKKGYDTALYEVMAYSTAGWFPDPFFSSMFKYDKPTLSDTVIHELTHNTVFMKNDSNFNESVANFMGKMGSREFIKSIAGKDSNLYRQAVTDAEDQDLLNTFLNRVYQGLHAFYSRKDLSSEEKIAQRDRIFLAHRKKFKTDYLPRFHHPEAMKALGDFPVNNAQILQNRRYNHRTDLFEKVYQACHQDLKRTVGVFIQSTQSGNAWQYLQGWLSHQDKS